MRDVESRVADVERLLAAARAVYAERGRIASQIARSTGLSPEGVELGFQSLEREATPDELRAFVASAGNAGHAHVILSANVFVAPLRAIALARASADRVTIRPSDRDPILARALVAAASDEAISLVRERDVSALAADAVHVYGRESTIASVRARARGVVVAHGPGMGVAVVTLRADISSAADALAADIVPFDQRGCLSPRVAIVEGDEERAASFARALDESLHAWGGRVPRGALYEEERTEAARWRETAAFTGRVWTGAQHTVSLGAPGSSLAVPPPGRHLAVCCEPTLAACAARIGPLADWVVAMGTDDPERLAGLAPSRVRVSKLARMQHPLLDGPVDLRQARVGR